MATVTLVLTISASPCSEKKLREVITEDLLENTRCGYEEMISNDVEEAAYQRDILLKKVHVKAVLV